MAQSHRHYLNRKLTAPQKSTLLAITSRKRLPRTPEQEELLTAAKAVIMGDLDCPEPTAYALIRSTAMQCRATIERICVLILGRQGA